MRVFAIMTAAGISTRMGNTLNKLLLLVNGKTVLERSLRPFQDSAWVDSIILVCRPDDREAFADIAKQFPKVSAIVDGGKERQDSVWNGLKAIPDAASEDIVLVHNGGNPLVDRKTIKDCIEAAKLHGAAVACIPSRDTVKVGEDGFVAKTIDRKRIFLAQTPQAARFGVLKAAFEKANADGYQGTDDVSLVERIGQKVAIVECPPENIKMTLPSDIAFAEGLCKGSRIGLGMDSHRYPDPKKSLVLGGVTFAGEDGFFANSDGDVVLHALFNAISQALGEKSLGHFADPMCKRGIVDSREYLKVILGIMRGRNFTIGNIGVMLEGSRPKISGKEESMKDSIARLADVPPDAVGVIATSGEELTEFGRGMGMQCFCVVTLLKDDAA
ncbi:MAG: 2-C-methyl-D-erythritol 4-phosphate cytidylyltransferase [Nanoarchaeota archaeon]